MNDRLKESLSALMDGESDDLEIGRVLKEAQDDAGILAIWDRYHLARGLMKRESVMPMSGRLAARLRESLNEEPALTGAAQIGSWAKPIASIAVAAAVAFAVVLGYQMLNAPGEEANPAVVAVPPAVTPVVDVGQGAVNAALINRRRLDAYMLHHAQHRALNERVGVIPIARVVSFESE